MNSLAPRPQPSAGTLDAVYQKNIDKSLHATLSLYISSERMDKQFKNWNKQKRFEIRDHYEHTKELRRAIDPLFNDIAIRERNSTVEEFLIDVKGAREVEKIVITLPSEINWETEGAKFKVNLGEPVSHELKCRMFWYAHADGALTYHISFFMEYEHEFKDYYFLSMLQKLMFPKEFYIPREVDLSTITPHEIASGNTALWLLDRPLVSALADYTGASTRVESLSFWQYVRKRFVRHMEDLIGSAKIEFQDGVLHASRQDSNYFWEHLIEKADFIEAPYLKAPPARALFLFQDKEFFELLQENKRRAIRNNPNYQVHMPSGWENLDVVEITVDDFHRHPSLKRDFDIRYYFLSGFFQNIIDFLNQDVTEIRDGTDPIYPVTDEQQEEAFFVRFANGRATYQVVERSRSLEVGNDFIGTCPYIFLVHLMALHNEFVVRKYELETTEVQDKLSNEKLTKYGDLEALLSRGEHDVTEASELKKATQPFYAFRYRAFAIYKRHLYINTFRYDTERDVFDKLQQIRGTEPRLRRCDDIVSGLDKTIQDIEEEKRYQEQRLQAESDLKRMDSDRTLNLAVFGVGIFSALQVFYAAMEKLSFLKRLYLVDRFPYLSLQEWGYKDFTYAILDFLTFALVVACAVVVLRAVGARRAARQTPAAPRIHAR